MFNARIIDFCFHIYPNKTFGEIKKFSEHLFKIRDYIIKGIELHPVIGVIDGQQITLDIISSKESITWKLEFNGVIWLIHDNIGATPNQDFSRTIIDYMALHFHDKSLKDIFGFNDNHSNTPISSDLYALWIHLIDQMNESPQGFVQGLVFLGQDKAIRTFNINPDKNKSGGLVGKVDIIDNGVFNSFVINTNGIPFKESMKLRTTLIKQKGSFLPTSTLSSNTDFTQKEF